MLHDLLTFLRNITTSVKREPEGELSAIGGGSKPVLADKKETIFPPPVHGKTNLANTPTPEPISLHLKIKELHARNGVPWEDINIFGVRDETDIERDIWNDIIVVVIGQDVRVFAGTTDPGIYWADNRNRKKHGWEKGCAHLCLGYHKDSYKVGKHRGYEALVQWGNKVKIWRDIDEDFKHDETEIVKSGWFGINIHHGYDAKSIGKASAGCQVIRKKEDFLKFMEFVKSSPRYKKSKSARFSYMLYEKNQVPFLEELRAGVI